MTYRISYRNHLYSLDVMMYSLIFLIGGIFYLNEIGEQAEGIIIVFGIGYSISFLPAIYIHIEYYLKNKNDFVKIDGTHRTFSFNAVIVSFDEIDRIVLYMPPAWHRKSPIRIMAFENYHYARIITKEGQEFIFTCLLSPRVEEVMEQICGVPIEKKKRILASISLH